MPAWYVHIQAAAETMDRLKKRVPPGSPLTQQEANDLFKAAHDHRNYLAAGALGPDLFFLLPDFKGDVGMGVLGLVEFVLKTWKAIDETFLEQWEQWMAPVMDNNRQLGSALSGGMLGEVAQVLELLAASVPNVVLGIAGQMVDVFGVMSSGTQTGYGDPAFFWSDAFHYRKTYQFARRLYANALKADEVKDDEGKPDKPANEPSRVPKQQAFALGWMSHCATDVAAHPWTNAKCGGPYRTHWARHHLIENHMDGAIYAMQHPPTDGNYESLDTSAMHFRLAFLKGSRTPDPAMPDDVPSYDYFPSSWDFPSYAQGDEAADYAERKKIFGGVDTEPLPEHICQLLLKTMEDVYTKPNDENGPQFLRWTPGKHIGDGGRPTVAVLQDMFQLAFEYAKFSSSSGLAPRKPLPPDVISDFDLPRLPGLPADGGGADPANARPVTILDVLLAILLWQLFLIQFIIWLLTVPAQILTSLSTWPLREALYQLLVVPAWDLYMLSRTPLVLEGFLPPKPTEVSRGLVVLGADEKGPLVQLRADLDAPSGFASLVGLAEPSGLDGSRGATRQGYSLDPAYPRATVTDLDPPWLDKAPQDAGQVPSAFVAPWRYPSHNMAGMRNGWEAPRTHVGPYLQGQGVHVLMNSTMPGSDAARKRFEAAKTPEETEAVSAELLTMAGAHLGDPIDYGAYLIGQLTGDWVVKDGKKQYVAHDAAAPLPDYNLDSDRGYAYQCWDYDRHPPSRPPAPWPGFDTDWPNQWGCVPQIESLLSKALGRPRSEIEADIRDWYGYDEPCTVPQRYDPADNPHHRSRYDPLKRLAHHYLPREGDVAHVDCGGIDLQVSEAEMRAVGMSPTGRLIP